MGGGETPCGTVERAARRSPGVLRSAMRASQAVLVMAMACEMQRSLDFVMNCGNTAARFRNASPF